MKTYEFLFEEEGKQRVVRFEGPLHEAAKKAVTAARKEAKARSTRIVVSIKSMVNHQIAEIDFAQDAA